MKDWRMLVTLSKCLYSKLLFFFSFPPEISTSHRSEKSELSIGEEIEEDLSVEIDDVNTSDKVWCCASPVECYLCLLPWVTVKLQNFILFAGRE